MNEELAAISDMGDESRKAFERRVEKLKSKQRRAAAVLNQNGDEVKEKWRDFRIVEKKIETPRISSFILEALHPDPEAGEMQLGAHARLRLPNGLQRSYSIVSGTPNRFELGIALEEPSRGGSSYLHSTAQIGDIVQIGRVTTDVKPAGSASNHVFIAGGIGITAFLSMLEMYRKIHWESTLHYGVRDASSDVPFRSRIEALSDSVKMYDRAKGQRMDIAAIFSGLPWNSHVYVCGPQRMMDEAIREAKARGLGEDEVHFEAFGADTSGDPFEVEVTSAREKSSTVLKVGAEETLLEVLKRHFGDDDVPSSCEVGNCGTCKVVLKSGRVDHRGTSLMEEERKDAMLSCVSRGIGKIAIEI
ncbi:putative dioxygenase subunit beta YeaX [Daldinia childiae]|nr:putative dioxygenase subunit beta YeaX [Daldinia childiae]KAF3058371.1 putative dioxygenase subunit beta YeaX [Daldinia childiae]